MAVHHPCLQFSVLVYWLQDEFFVGLVGFGLDFQEDLRVVGEDLFVKELLGEGEASKFLHVAQVYETTLAIADNVVVTDQLRTVELLADVLGLLRNTVGNKTKPDTYGTLSEEIHLRYFILFIVYHAVFISWLKLSGKEPECYVIQKPCLLHTFHLEEILKFVEDIGEQVDSHDLVLKLVGKVLQVLLVRIETLKPVVCPEVSEVLLNLLSNGLLQPWVVGKPRELDHPVVKVTALIHSSHFLLVVANDLNEVSHDVGKEGNASQHDQYCDDSLDVADRVVVTISDGTECGKCKVTTDY